MKLTKETEAALALAYRSFMYREEEFLPLIQDIWDFVMPERQIVRRSGKNANDFYDNIYDSTAVHGAESLANDMVSGLTPPWVPFFMLEPGPLVKGQKRDQLRAALEPVNKLLFMYINMSNFTQEIQPSYLDALVGTGCVTIEPHVSGKGVQFKNIPLNEIMVDESVDGQLDRVYRYYDMAARDILALYEDECRELVADKDLYRQMKERPEDKHCVWAVTVPIEGTKKYRHIVALEKTRDKYVLRDVKLKRNPYIVFRWSKMPHTTMGRGPAMRAYPDVRLLNKILEHALRSAALNAAGVFTAVDDGVFNPYSVKLEPGAILPVMSNNEQNPAMRRLEVGGDLDISQFAIQDLRSGIKKAFHADRFGPVEGPKMTATEVLHRAKIIAQELGATYGRFQTELLIPLIKKLVDILSEQGLIPKNLNIGDQFIDVVFISQLAQAQRLQEVDNLMQFIAFGAQAAQFDPAAGQVIDHQQALRLVAEQLQVTPRVLRTTEEVEQRMADAQEAAMAMGEAAMGGMNGEAAGAGQSVAMA